MRKVANSLVPTCANMCQLPALLDHMSIWGTKSQSEHRSSCSSLRKALSPHLPLHSYPKSPPKPHAETARSLVESWSHLQERVFLTQAFLNDPAATKTGLATQRTCSRQDVAKRPPKQNVMGGLQGLQGCKPLMSTFLPKAICICFVEGAPKELLHTLTHLDSASQSELSGTWGAGWPDPLTSSRGSPGSKAGQNIITGWHFDFMKQQPAATNSNQQLTDVIIIINYP